MPHGARSACADQDPHKIPQPASAVAARPARPKGRAAVRSGAFATASGRPATRGDGHQVIELEYGVTVYPARAGQDRWRAVWHENGTRRRRKPCTQVDQLPAPLPGCPVGRLDEERPVLLGQRGQRRVELQQPFRLGPVSGEVVLAAQPCLRTDSEEPGPLLWTDRPACSPASQPPPVMVSWWAASTDPQLAVLHRAKQVRSGPLDRSRCRRPGHGGASAVGPNRADPISLARRAVRWRAWASRRRSSSVTGSHCRTAAALPVSSSAAITVRQWVVSPRSSFLGSPDRT
jgi:hypothetical protein